MLFFYVSNAVTICAMMESIHQKHDVTWETYDEDMREALHRMMIENVLTDVTLVSDDQIKIQAHKIILNASSPVFQTFISSFEDLPRAVIYLKGVKYEEMRHVLDFIYLGEISIEQDKLATFLSLSENLQLKGVNDKQMNTYSHEDSDSTEENMFLHKDSINDLQEPDKKMFTDHSDTFFFFCSQCKYKAKEKSTLNIHTQVKHKHESFRFSCKHCVWTGRKPGSLQIHMKLLRYYGETFGHVYKFECQSQNKVYLCIYGYDKGKLSSAISSSALTTSEE